MYFLRNVPCRDLLKPRSNTKKRVYTLDSNLSFGIHVAHDSSFRLINTDDPVHAALSNYLNAGESPENAEARMYNNSALATQRAHKSIKPGIVLCLLFSK